MVGTSVAATFSTGLGAAQRVIELMRATFNKLPPIDIVDTYNSATNPADRVAKLWNKHGTATIGLMSDGCLCLAEIWASAWKEGGGEQIAAASLGTVASEILEHIFSEEPDFLPSVGLKALDKILKKAGAPSNPAGPAPKKKSKKKKRTAKRKKKRKTKK